MNASACTFLFGGCPPAFGAALDARTGLHYLIYAAALVLVSVIVTLWIVTLRQPPVKDSNHRRQRSTWRIVADWISGDKGESPDGKRRRKRRAHRRRNPTLAETGGLPPIRNQSPSTEKQPD